MLTEPCAVKIRPAVPSDAKDIQSIYAPYVTETAITFEYEVPSVNELANRIAATSAKYPYLVAEIDNQMVGYAYASAFGERQAYDYSCELSIYVGQSSTTSGIGQALYNALEALLKKQNIVNIVSIIALPNEKSVNFHYKNGFKQIGHFPNAGYKFEQWHDIVWLLKVIQPPF